MLIINVDFLIPDDLLAAGNPVYVLRLHDGTVDRLETRVENGLACFASDVFSKYALAYDTPDTPDAPDTPDTPDAPDAPNVPETPEDNVQPPADDEISEETGDACGKIIWLSLLLPGAGTAMFTIKAKKRNR